MTVLIDSGVFYAQADTSASRHDEATAALAAVLQNELGHPYTTDYVYDETVTLTLARTGSHTKAARVGRRLRGVEEFPELVTLQHVTPSVFERAVELFDRLDDQNLSFTDATTIANCREHDVDTVLSFDDDFDGLVDRTDPTDL